MKEFIHHLRESIDWAILWNHEKSIQYHTTTYVEAGFFSALLFFGCFVVCLICGDYLLAGFYFAILVGEAFLARYIWRVINGR